MTIESKIRIRKELHMIQAKSGDTVSVDYTGKLADGSVFDTSATHGPLAFTIGEGEVIPEFEQAVIGLLPGEAVTIDIPAEQAYGMHRPDLAGAFAREQFPADMSLNIGEQLQMQSEDGQLIVVTITSVTETEVTLDANHLLAGKDLTFDIKLVDIAA